MTTTTPSFYVVETITELLPDGTTDSYPGDVLGPFDSRERAYQFAPRRGTTTCSTSCVIVETITDEQSSLVI